MDKKETRLRRARRARARIKELGATRLCIHRTPRHIYAQIIGPDGGTVLASASTLEAEVRKGIKNGGNVEAAAIVGARIAEKAFEHLDGPIVRIAPPDTPVPYSPPLEEAFLPQIADVVAKAKELAAY